MAERILFQELLPDSTIAVIGAGNGGQAMAGFLALKGFGVNLWNRSKQVNLLQNRRIVIKARSPVLHAV